MALVIRPPSGDRRNWGAIRAWAAALPAALGLAEPAPKAAAVQLSVHKFFRIDSTGFPSVKSVPSVDMRG